MLLCYPPKDEGKPLLKVDFVDFGFIDKARNFFTELLRPHYEVMISDKPDLLFFSDTAGSHLHRLYNCKRVFWTGESTMPDFHFCDFAMTPRQLTDPRHCQLPFYVVGTECNAGDLVKKQTEAESVFAEKRRGCGAVISNTGKKAVYRNRFFYKLAKRMDVRSGGRGFNNIGGPIPPGGNAKHEFIRQFRFNMCFENLSFPGYATEKLVEAMWARCIPIYWGDPEIAAQFNPHSFINVSDFDTEEAAIERIIQIDGDDELYIKMLEEPFFHDNRPNEFFELDRYADFLRSAIDSTDPPVAHCRRSWFGRWRVAKRMH
jgi:hypothetical protein